MVPFASDPEIARTLSELRAVSASRFARSVLPDEEQIIPPTNSIPEACEKYADRHFENVPRGERTFYAFYDPVFSEDGEEANVGLLVAFKSWGYTQQLVLQKNDGMWALAQVLQTSHLSFEEEGYTAANTLAGTKLQTSPPQKSPPEESGTTKE